MGGQIERYFVPVAVGFAPVLLAILSWAPEGMSPMQLGVRNIHAPILGAELFTIAVALRSGLLAAMRQWHWRPLPTVAAALLILIAIVTAVLAPNPFAARLWTAIWLLHLLFGISVAHLCRQQLRPRDFVVSYVAGLVSFMLLLGVFAARVTDPGFDWTRDWPAAAHIRHFGYLAAAMIALVIGMAARMRGRRGLALAWLLAVAGFTFALWTGSRGTLFGVAGGFGLALLLLPSLRRLLLVAGIITSMAAGALIASFMPAPGPLMGVARTISQTVDSGEVTTGRTRMWSQTIDAIGRRPLFGYGEAQMPTVSPFADLSQPHQIVLQIALAWGLVGLACATVLAIWFMIRSVPVVRGEGGDLVPPFLAVLAIAALALIDNSLFNTASVSIFAACAGMIASRWQAAPRR